MKKHFRNAMLILIAMIFTVSQSAYATSIREITAKDGTKHSLVIFSHDTDPAVTVAQYGDIISSAPSVNIIIDGLSVHGTYAYPNYDNTRLGVWDLEWIFTPDDNNFGPITGIIRIDVIQVDDEEVIEQPTTPSLTATTIQLDTRTAYDINLNDRVSGSSYTWASSDVEVVEVNSTNGKLKAIKEGKANITCEITLPDTSTQTLVSEVTVGYDANAPLLTETDLDLEIGDVFDVNLENKVAKSKYRWVSSDKGIAKVNSSNGKVTAVSAGDAYVTCTITTPENQVIVLRCDISVTVPTTVTE